jgi:hypothetical protein
MVCAAILAAAVAARAADRALDEYQVKAAYLYNFAKFVEWPAAAFAAPDAPLVIGVFGEDPFGPALDELVRDKTVKGRRCVVRRSVRMRDLRSSHIVFIGASPEPVAQALRELEGASVLTVGESPRLLDEGGIVLFSVDGGRVAFTVHVGAAARARLTISSQLLRLARVTGLPKP